MNPTECGSSHCCNRFNVRCCGGTGPFNPYDQGIDKNEKVLENDDSNLNEGMKFSYHFYFQTCHAITINFSLFRYYFAFKFAKFN